MELRQLEHFIAVAEERHFSRAADRMHIVQSGLSSSVRSLERELGATLFVRSTRRVELTEAGRALLPEARLTLAALQRAREAVGAVEGLLRGTLGIGIMQVLDPIDLPGLLASFRSAHPNVELCLRQGAAADVLSEVRDGVLDVAFVGTAPLVDGIELRTLVDEPMALAVPAGHRLAGRASITLRSVAGESIIEFPPGWSVRTDVDWAFAAAGLVRKSAFEVNDVATMLDLVAHGLGAAIVPNSVAVRGRSIELVPLRVSDLRWVVRLATRGTDTTSAAGRAFADLVSTRTGVR